MIKVDEHDWKTDALDHEVHALLSRVSTATVSTQLFKRGFRNVFMQGVVALHKPVGMNLVGPAFTLRNIPAREDLDIIEAFQDPDHPQRRAIETAPLGSVLVQDCRGETTTACCGSILLTRLKVRGVAGMVADGPVRDSGTIEGLGLPVFCSGRNAQTNLVKHHAIDMNLPIGCGGVPVYPGDILVGDIDGVVVIPRHLAADVAADSAEQEQLEEFISGRICDGALLRGTYPANEDTKQEYRRWKSEQGGIGQQ
jgi:regulator of RNase E activity RraA